MNIFILDEHIPTNVSYYIDKWVVKMPLETAQILCTVRHMYNLPAPYKPTHQKHPCVKWAYESKSNFEYLRELGYAICSEYTYRYGKVHKCKQIIEESYNIDIPFKNVVPTKPYLAMPKEYHRDSVVESYRLYCIYGKQHVKQSWTKRNRPEWWPIPTKI